MSSKPETKAGKKLETCSLNSKLWITKSIQSGKKTTITVPINAPAILLIPPRTAAVKSKSESDTG
jgi:hypothetical protein